MLTNPYYKGVVRYKGVEYPGKHEPLVGAERWQRVQELLAAKNEVRQKERIHPHYLKGILCGHCGSRMIVTHAKSRAGRVYPYFVCVGRHQKRTDCTMKAVLIDRVEELVEEHYAAIELPIELREPIEARVRADLDAYFAEAHDRQARLDKHRDRLLAERAKLLQAHYADAIPLDLLKQEQQRISTALEPLAGQRAASEDRRALIETNLKRCLELASSCQTAYGSAPPSIRKLFNQAFFTKLYIDDDDTVRSELAPPLDVLLSPALRKAARTAAVAMSKYKNAPKESFLEGVRQTWTTVVAGLKELGLVGGTCQCANQPLLVAERLSLE